MPTLNCKKENLYWLNFLIRLQILFIYGSTIQLSTSGDTGEIGDTIGDTTAPIVSLIGSILVYITFLNQIETNKLQFKIILANNQKEEIEKLENKNTNDKLMTEYNRLVKNKIKQIFDISQDINTEFNRFRNLINSNSGSKRFRNYEIFSKPAFNSKLLSQFKLHELNVMFYNDFEIIEQIYLITDFIDELTPNPFKKAYDLNLDSKEFTTIIDKMSENTEIMMELNYSLQRAILKFNELTNTKENKRS